MGNKQAVTTFHSKQRSSDLFYFDDGLCSVANCNKPIPSLHETYPNLLEQFLPQEIIIHILKYTNAMDLIRISWLSRNFREFYIFQNELITLWKGPFDLFISPCQSKELERRTSAEIFIFKFLFYKRFVKRLSSMFQVFDDEETHISQRRSVGLIGGEKCGKSACLDLICGKPFSEQYNMTIGVDFNNVHMKRQSNGSLMRFLIWDVAGNIRFSSHLAGSRYHKDRELIFMFDLSREESFNEMVNLMHEWLVKLGVESFEKVNAKLGSKEKMICIVGTKSDLERRVPNDHISSLVNSFIVPNSTNFHDLRIQYFEISSKLNRDVLLPLFFVATEHSKYELVPSEHFAVA